MKKFWMYYLDQPENAKEIALVNKMIDNTVLPLPQWYFFSSSDTMIYASEIRRHMLLMEEKTGIHPNYVDFMTSNHVSHYREQPFEYSKRVDSVLDHVEHNWKLLLDHVEKMGILHHKRHPKKGKSKGEVGKQQKNKRKKKKMRETI